LKLDSLKLDKIVFLIKSTNWSFIWYFNNISINNSI